MPSLFPPYIFLFSINFCHPWTVIFIIIPDLWFSNLIFIIIPWNFLKFSHNFFRLSHYSKVNQFSFFFRQIVIFITITKTNVLFISKSYPHYSHLSLLIMWITFRKSFIFPHFFDFSMLISWKLLFFIFLLFWIFLSYFRWYFQFLINRYKIIG